MMRPLTWKLAGGLNLVRDAVSRHRAPGELVGCMNYESREEGYRRIDGYERYDGRPAPSNTNADEPGTEAVETEKRRRAITQVPGDELLAVWRFRDRTWAFSLVGDTLAIWRSSSTGWSRVELGWQVAFTNGSGDAPEKGDVITAGTVSATVVGVHLESGSWAEDDAAGYIVLDYRGEFSDEFAAADFATGSEEFAADTAVVVDGDATRTLTLRAVPRLQTLGTGRSFRFVNHNFFGRSDRERMYGVSGVGNPFEFDGELFIELDTGVTGAHPTRIVAHEKHLFVGYEEGSIVHSGLGKPRSFDADDGAGEIAIGDTLTELLAGYRNTLFVFGRNKTAYLVGTSSSDFVLKVLSEEAGAMAATAVMMNEPTILDDRGLRNVTATDAFGDFSIATMSEPIRPLLDFKRAGGARPVAATRIRAKSQYRLWFSDGDCLVCNFVRRGGRLVAEYTRFAYDVVAGDGHVATAVLTGVCSVEDSDGRERVFFTLKDRPFVYEMDRGASFDGIPIPFYLRLAYNDFKMPHTIKRYRKLLIEVDSVHQSTFSMSADFDDDLELGEQGPEQTVLGPSAFWDESDWDAFYWDVVPTRKAEQRIHGRGRNISVAVFARPEKVEESHTLTGVTCYFDVRRLIR